ncbi:venom serine carboxypeptidase-like [Battus philenor]|uniref:venom serine carboxypeptidase-like n=1 Tax=Battus philenor TaxID=42288 RepID=UPI0035D0203B
MNLLRFFVCCMLNIVITSVNSKVILNNNKIAEILNSVDRSNNKVSSSEDNRSVLSEFTTTETHHDFDDDDDKNIKDEITKNDIDDDLEANKTSNEVAVESEDHSCEDSKIDDISKANVNTTENLSPLILTPYIENGKIDEARNASLVDPQMFLGVKSYSGYFTVNKTYNSNIFFWYFPVENNPIKKTPWIIWLQGGPGASSMTGLFDEIGPFKVDATLNLTRNPYTWLQNHSLVFFDNPVGTGFSYTEDRRGYTRDMATYSSHLYTAFHQFLQVFPELRSAPLYVAGESYAGKYVPGLGIEIHKHMLLPGHRVNLQGFIIGNAYVDPAVITKTIRPFYNFGLIEQEEKEALKPLEDALLKEVAAKNGTMAKVKWMNMVSVLLTMSHQTHAYNFVRNELAVGRHVLLMNKPHMQRALHVRATKFNFVNTTVNAHLASDFLSSAKEHFETLLEHYRVLAYCGQLDLMMPCVTTSENYRTWKWNKSDKFIKAPRLPYLYLNKRAGYYKTGGGFTEVVFVGAGHMVPLDVPAPAQDLVTRWIHKIELSKRFPILENSFLEEFIKNNTVIYL